MTPTSADGGSDNLRQLLQWWRVELDDTRAAQLDQRSKRPWPERLAGGYALEGLTFVRREQKRSTGVLLWFGRRDRQPLPHHRIRSGYPALLWPGGGTDEGTQPAPEQSLQRCKIVRITKTQLCLRLPDGYDHFIERGVVQLEREESEVTFQRGDDAIRALLDDQALGEKRALLFGDAVPAFDAPRELTFRDEQLNLGQRTAVEQAARARHAMLIVGPPGTGKTRVLVEVVRQALLMRRRILVTAASNVAVDNITRRLAACGVKVLRLGASHKVAPDLAEDTLQHKMSKLPEMAESQSHFDAAQRLADGKGRRLSNPGRRIGELRRQAHQCRDMARAKVMRRSRVVCATAGGVDAVPLGDETFDLVVLDEATQAPDPVALSAIERGAIAVLAGDPQQLPPTVISRQEDAKAGLSSTLFQRCSERWPAEATAMLTTQYRMSEALMQYPSAAHYDGRLQADDSNRHHALRDLVPNAKLSERDAMSWIVVDTAAAGATEAFDDKSSSFYNGLHLRLVVTEIQRLVDHGVEAHHIAAICPYSAQTWRLRQQLSALLELGLEIGTVDGFQGREKEVVIVDLVRANAEGQLGFLQDVRRTNVAITRAKRQLIVVANGDTISSHPYYRRLLGAAKSAGAWEAASDLSSRAD